MVRDRVGESLPPIDMGQFFTQTKVVWRGQYKSDRWWETYLLHGDCDNFGWYKTTVLRVLSITKYKEKQNEHTNEKTCTETELSTLQA